MSKMGPLIRDLSNIKVPLLNHSKWRSNNISSVSNTSANPDPDWNNMSSRWYTGSVYACCVVKVRRCRCSRWTETIRVLTFCYTCSPLQMRSYNRHTLVADPYEDGFGDFILKKQKMIELEKKVRSPVKSHHDKFAINITFSNPERCVTESGSLWNGEVMLEGSSRSIPPSFSSWGAWS